MDDKLLGQILGKLSSVYSRGEHGLPSMHYRDSEEIISLVTKANKQAVIEAVNDEFVESADFHPVASKIIEAVRPRLIESITTALDTEGGAI